jgi:NADPH:quinone reductase-like Zn-dependent oxidoreductase
VTCGGTTGHELRTDVRRLFWNQWTIMGSTMGSDDEFDAVAAELRSGRLTPVVDSVFAMDEARQAYERLQGGAQFGKVVIQVA